jgi:hypothetical protein
VINLDAICDRAGRAAPELEKIFHGEYEIRPVRASARDVPALLAEVQALTEEVARLRGELDEMDRWNLEKQSDLVKSRADSALIDTLKPLVVAALGFAENSEDTSALERLAEEADRLPWATMDALGIKDNDD